MRQCIGGRRPDQSLRCPLPKRTTGCGQDEAVYRYQWAAVQTLVDGVVLAVDRQDLNSAAPRGIHDESAGHHQHFLVRQRYRLPRFNRREHGIERRRAGGGAQHHIHIGMSSHFQETASPGPRCNAATGS